MGSSIDFEEAEVGLGLDCLEPIAEMLPLLEELALSVYATEDPIPRYPRTSFGPKFRRLTFKNSFLNFETPSFDFYDAARYISCMIGTGAHFECTVEASYMYSFRESVWKKFDERYRVACQKMETMVNDFVRIRADEGVRLAYRSAVRTIE